MVCDAMGINQLYKQVHVSADMFMSNGDYSN